MAEPVLNVVKKYRGEFEETYDGLRKRAVQLQDAAKTEFSKYQEKLTQLQPQLLQQRDDLVKTLQDVVSFLSFLASLYISSFLVCSY